MENKGEPPDPQKPTRTLASASLRAAASVMDVRAGLGEIHHPLVFLHDPDVFEIKDIRTLRDQNGAGFDLRFHGDSVLHIPNF
jgi:hypothetical protein